MLCEGAGGADLANITNIAAICGLVYGAAQKLNGSALRIMNEPGARYRTPMYSCVSMTRAIIKTVTFRFNGSDDASGISVLNITNKKYDNQSSLPLWGVENLSLPLSSTTPIWGLIDEKYIGTANLSTLRKESLLLPGYSGFGVGISSIASSQNLPGINFPADALSAIFDISSSKSVDYTGASNIAMFRRWQDLTKSPNTTAQMLNLIWTDVAANLVVGTRSISDAATVQPQKKVGNLTKRADGSAPRAGENIPVSYFERRIRYHFVYAIPAFIVLFLTIAIFLLALTTVVLGQSSPRKMRKYLNETSAGRILAAGLYADAPIGRDGEATGRWLAGVGKRQITLGAGRPIAAETGGYKVVEGAVGPDGHMQKVPLLVGGSEETVYDPGKINTVTMQAYEAPNKS